MEGGACRRRGVVDLSFELWDVGGIEFCSRLTKGFKRNTRGTPSNSSEQESNTALVRWTRPGQFSIRTGRLSVSAYNDI